MKFPLTILIHVDNFWRRVERNKYVYTYILDEFFTLFPSPYVLQKDSRCSLVLFLFWFSRFVLFVFFGACTVYFYCRFGWRVAAISMARCLTRGKCEHLSLGQRADSWQQTATPLAVVGAGGLSTLKPREKEVKGLEERHRACKCNQMIIIYIHF